MYHLKKLIAQGLVKRIEKGYVLTAHGNRYVDTLSMASFQPRFQPKIVTLIILRNRKGEYLLFERRRQPFHGLLGFPYGKVHFGESIIQAAHRELKEKTGLSARLAHRGEVYLTIYNESRELMAHMLCHVFLGDQPKGIFRENSSGACTWGKAEMSNHKRWIPGFLDLFKLATGKAKNVFAEITVSS